MAEDSGGMLALLRRAPPFEGYMMVLSQVFGIEQAVEVKHFPDCTYATAAGVSLAFDGREVPAKRRLGCIHVTPPCGITLPHGLLLGMSGKQLVEVHGEPGTKGGGHTMGSIFVVYPNLGFQANFERPEWTGDNTVKGFDLFRAEGASDEAAPTATQAHTATQAVQYPGISVPVPAASTNLEAPQYELTNLPSEPGTHQVSQALRLTVKLPLAKSMKAVNLQVSSAEVSLDVAQLYAPLIVALPFAIDETSTRASFSKRTRVLDVVLPLSEPVPRAKALAYAG
jgi:hypothetical protein